MRARAREPCQPASRASSECAFSALALLVLLLNLSREHARHLAECSNDDVVDDEGSHPEMKGAGAAGGSRGLKLGDCARRPCLRTKRARPGRCWRERPARRRRPQREGRRPSLCLLNGQKARCERDSLFSIKTREVNSHLARPLPLLALYCPQFGLPLHAHHFFAAPRGGRRAGALAQHPLLALAPPAAATRRGAVI